MRRWLISAGLLACWGVAAQAAAPQQCWYYLHRTLDAANEAACAAKAEAYLDGLSGGQAETKPSSADHVLGVSAVLGEFSAQVFCYEVNGDRGPIMAVIMTAGNTDRAAVCGVAESIFEEMTK